MRAAVIVLALGVVACGPNERGQQADANGSHADAPPPGIDGVAPFFGAIYAHSYQHLYKVDPDTLEVTLIGAFDWPAGYEDELMTDIAVDADEHITGITFGNMWSIDNDTAHVSFINALSGTSFNGMTFRPDQGGGPDILVATGLDGKVWQLDPGTGMQTQIGAYGGQTISSGDMVSILGYGTIATVKQGSEIDYLARIDENTGVATIIGSTGYADIWGLGYWRNKAYGFVATNEFVTIDVLTGAATYISTGPENWAGAGVTTHAPIEP